jgi:hypothetical protein
MPLLIQLLFTVIITNLLPHHQFYRWIRPPTPRPPLVHLHQWFIGAWNKGLYPSPKLKRYRNTAFGALTYNIPPHEIPTQVRHEPSPPAMGHIVSPLVMPSHPQSPEENVQLQALLYSLNTPTQDTTIHFGSDFERICIDTGASACISTRKKKSSN